MDIVAFTTNYKQELSEAEGHTDPANWVRNNYQYIFWATVRSVSQRWRTCCLFPNVNTADGWVNVEQIKDVIWLIAFWEIQLTSSLHLIMSCASGIKQDRVSRT